MTTPPRSDRGDHGDPSGRSVPDAAPRDPLLDRPGGRRVPQPVDDKTQGVHEQHPRDAGAWKRSIHGWARRLHVYTSMIALLMILFFGLTGIVLNHPEWAFGDETETTTVDGVLPFDVMSDEGVVDFLAVSEYLRDTHGVNGSVDDYRADPAGGSISYANPGYSADAFFDLDTGEYELTVNQDAFVAVMTDLHTGTDAGSAWGWMIDLSAGFLVIVSLTGLVMQFFLRKRRRPALTAAMAGAAASIALMFVTLS